MSNSNEIRYVARTTISRVFDEWTVRAYDQHGKRYSEADYYTDDKVDAKGTAELMVKPFMDKLSQDATQAIIRILAQA